MYNSKQFGTYHPMIDADWKVDVRNTQVKLKFSIKFVKFLKGKRAFTNYLNELIKVEKTIDGIMWNMYPDEYFLFNWEDSIKGNDYWTKISKKWIHHIWWVMPWYYTKLNKNMILKMLRKQNYKNL